MNKFLIVILSLISCILITSIQISFILNIAILSQIINLILFLSIYLIINNRIKYGILIASFGGLILDLQSTLNFGIIISALLFSIAVSLFFKENIFKKKALHAFAINMGISTFSYHTLLMLEIIIFTQMTIVNLELFNWYDYSIFAAIQIISHTFIIIIISLVGNYFNKHFVQHQSHE